VRHRGYLGTNDVLIDFLPADTELTKANTAGDRSRQAR